MLQKYFNPTCERSVLRVVRANINCTSARTTLRSNVEFLARSRSLYAVARPSVVCRLSSVTFVRPTQAVQIFGNISTTLGTLAIL